MVELFLGAFNGFDKTGGFKYFFMFIPILGEDEPILTSIFFKWVGSTTNYIVFVEKGSCMEKIHRRKIKTMKNIV